MLSTRLGGERHGWPDAYGQADPERHVLALDASATRPRWRSGRRSRDHRIKLFAHRGHTLAPPELAQHRRTARAELYRQINDDGTPNSWGLRLFNGHDEQQITVFFPSPFLSDEMQVLQTPGWSHLDLWDEMRKTYLGIEPDDRDRSGKRMMHG